jgi:uncharacterized membrane protein
VQIIRLSTVHPALVHFTIGALPFIVIGYGMAARGRSERWTFAADAALVVTAALTVATVAFGLVSNAIVPWPGGLALWRWLHLGLGAASAAALLVFAAVRLRRRQRLPTSGGASFGGAVAVAILVGVAAWIGGEVLVFQSGIAVRAAGEGALAPLATRPRTPTNLRDAMDRLRAAWAASESTMSEMIVHSPGGDDFAAIARDARQMNELAQWIGVEGPTFLRNPGRPSEHHHEDRESEDLPMTAGEHLAMMARELGAQTAELERAAGARDVTRAARALAEVQAECVDCHSEMRWPARATPAMGSARPIEPGVLGQQF